MAEPNKETNEIEEANSVSEAGSVEELDVFDDIAVAKDGIHKLLNNQFEESLQLFLKHKEESPLMHAGYSFVFFMQGLMSFEEELMDKALKALEETEKKCEVSDGFVKSIRKKFSSKKKRDKMSQISVEERIQRQIVVGDSLLYQAILVFTGQDIPSYIKGGWLLRKAWKIYEKIYKEVTGLREKSKLKKSGSKSSVSDVSTTSKGSEGPIDGNDNEIPSEVLDRLQGAVNFGYGTFQICISMIPPKILKVIEFLGFEGDRDVGLQCLNFACNSDSMNAPLATLGLLWYHTVLRPFFALDGANGYDAGCIEAEALIEAKVDSFPSSCLFLFFRGRIHRLRKQTDLSLKMYSDAYKAAGGQKELELMCLYEIGWCSLMQLNWREGLKAFTRLRQETKWSKCYYTYMEAVCLGGMGDINGAFQLFKQVPGLLKKKNNQIEAYVSARAEKMKRAQPSQEFCRLLTLELIFLWHALPTLTAEELRPYLDVCDMQTDPKSLHIKALLEGAIFNQLGEKDMALQCLDEAIARHSGMKDDLHIPPFALFEMASIHMTKPETSSKAQAMLSEIKEKHKDYDFENRLTVRVNNALKQLKKASA
ncbi:tetratricopeptide repeat protein 39C-like [Dreissena polymorpha]|uniref:tetratricopeptide repeat protein 39C-like n=1 Tax=Dreissena polymorpha TaxID=45954 RepID=UPI0022656530|nr:tetratricopeptide repeat protein 39C-like [Dreissena polymorpha]